VRKVTEIKFPIYTQSYIIKFNGVVSTVTRSRAWQSEVRIPAEADSCSPKCPDRLWGSTSLLLNAHRSPFPVAKGAGREVNHWPADVKNELMYTFMPHVCLHGLDMSNFTFTTTWTLEAICGPEGSRRLRFLDFMTTAPDGGKVVGLTHRPLLPPGNVLGTHFR